MLDDATAASHSLSRIQEDLNKYEIENKLIEQTLQSLRTQFIPLLCKREDDISKLGPVILKAVLSDMDYNFYKSKHKANATQQKVLDTKITLEKLKDERWREFEKHDENGQSRQMRVEVASKQLQMYRNKRDESWQYIAMIGKLKQQLITTIPLLNDVVETNIVKGKNPSNSNAYIMKNQYLILLERKQRLKLVIELLKANLENPKLAEKYWGDFSIVNNKKPYPNGDTVCDNIDTYEYNFHHRPIIEFSAAAASKEWKDTKELMPKYTSIMNEAVTYHVNSRMREIKCDAKIIDDEQANCLMQLGEEMINVQESINFNISSSNYLNQYPDLLEVFTEYEMERIPATIMHYLNVYDVGS